MIPLHALAAATLHRIIQDRRSIRRYRPEQLPAGLLQQLFEAARWAPSAHNRQPWRFAVLEHDAEKSRLAAAMGARLRQDRRTDGDDEATIERDAAISYARITGAPAVIVACFKTADMDVYPDPRCAAAERLMAVQSTAMALQNLLLAHAEGLAACWVCAPLFCPDTVRAVLGLPPDWQPQALVTIGNPAHPGRRRDRRALAEIVRR
jgi:F420 biosynthesis protein FbiB-like protein